MACCLDTSSDSGYLVSYEVRAHHRRGIVLSNGWVRWRERRNKCGISSSAFRRYCLPNSADGTKLELRVNPMKLVETIVVLVTTLFVMSANSSAQGEFLPRGRNGVGASFGGSFNEDGTTLSGAIGACIQGIVDIGAAGVSAVSADKTDKYGSVGPYIAYHLSKQSDSADYFETMIGVTYLPGRDEHFAFAFGMMRNVTDIQNFLFEPTFGVSWVTGSAGGHAALSAGAVVGVTYSGGVFALTPSVAYANVGETFKNGLSYGVSLSIVH